MVKDQDLEIYKAWVDGETQYSLADRYGVSQPAINQRIAKVQAQLPPVVKDQEVRRAAEQADEALAVYLPKALAGDTAASREARGWSALKARWLGVDRREVQVQGQVDHVWSPGPSVQELLERWMAEGRIQGQITRTDR